MDPFLGEIRLFTMGFAPRGWMACEGQPMPVQQNQALFAVLGTLYGGDGITTFNLPDLRGRVPLHAGATYVQGKPGGEVSHTLLSSEMPMHNHVASAATSPVSATSPANATWGALAGAYAPSPSATLNAAAIGVAGGNQPHANMQPYLALNLCIATSGIFPSHQ